VLAEGPILAAATERLDQRVEPFAGDRRAG
jgi:hypothetical protein